MSLTDELFEKRVRLIQLIDGIKDEDMLLDTGRAALYLDVSESTLAHRRSDQKPPPYVQLDGAGKGAKVKYRLGDLKAFVKQNLFGGTAEAGQRNYGAFLPAPWLLWADVQEHPFWWKDNWPIGISAFHDYELSFQYFMDERYEIRFSPWMSSQKLFVDAGDMPEIAERYIKISDEEDRQEEWLVHFEPIDDLKTK